MKLGVDVNRHKEIIVKAISAILLLLLKHFKLNHIYQVRRRHTPHTFRRASTSVCDIAIASFSYFALTEEVTVFPS